MNPEFQKILKRIFLSSLAAVGSVFAGHTMPETTMPAPAAAIAPDEKKRGGSAFPSLVLQQRDAPLEVAAHRSHSSHSSHRSSSHSSHRSATYTRPSVTPPMQTRPVHVTPRTPSGTTQKTSGTKDAPVSQKEEYKLGDRELSLDMTGADVVELANLLKRHGFLSNHTVVSHRYTTKISTAISDFQQQAGLPVTGKCSFETIRQLQQWTGEKKPEKPTTTDETLRRIQPLDETKPLPQPEKPTTTDEALRRIPQPPGETKPLPQPEKPTPVEGKLVLGQRELKLGDEGDDVRELRTLLIKFAVLDSRKKNSTQFDKGVEASVRALQRKMSLPTTGVFDHATFEDATRTLGQRDLRLNASGADVVELRILLIRQNLLRPSASASMLFDAEVEAAVRKLQRKLLLPSTGVFDKATFSKMKSWRGRK